MQPLRLKTKIPTFSNKLRAVKSSKPLPDESEASDMSLIAYLVGTVFQHLILVALKA